MLDPRIYRTGFIAVALAVVVFAFSLESQPGGHTTNLAPEAFNGPSVYSTIQKLANQYPHRRPGSNGDDALAEAVKNSLHSRGFSVSTDTYPASTADGHRTLETVSGTRAGLHNGTIVIVSHRDAAGSPDAADLSGTAVMLELARVLQGETLGRAVTLVSTSGSVGAVGATRLAHRLAGGQTDAVIVLGDLSGRQVTQPIVVPWSNGTELTPPVLRNTLAGALQSQAGLRPGGSGVAAQLARLAFPLTISEQGPFGLQGIPAVLLSTAGERGPSGDEASSGARITALGRAVLTTINALDASPDVPAPTAYLVFDHKIVPLWAVRLLVLALILPVLGATVDGVARVRRHGTRIGRWVLWVLVGALPFAIAAGLIRAAKEAGLLDAAPPGPVGAGAVPIHASGAALLAGVALIIGLCFWLLRPWCLRLAALIAGDEGPRSYDEGTGAALLLVLCVATLVIWLRNPFAAALIVPALHLWMWVVDPEVPLRRSVAMTLVAIGLLPPLLVIGYYAHALALSPVDLVWNGSLMIAGGHLGLIAALEWSVVLGCAAGVAIFARSIDRHDGQHAEAVTVRGPITYAGPGSLGGTESALRR